MVAAEWHGKAETKARKPRPWRLAAVENLFEMRRDPIAFFERLSRDAPAVSRLPLGPAKVTFLNDPDVIAEIFSRRAGQYPKGRGYARLRPLMGDSLFMLDGPAWSARRRMVQPSFRGEELRKMTRDMVSAVEIMLDRWHAACQKGEAVNVSEDASRLALDVALRCLFGDALHDRHAAVFDAIGLLQRELDRRMWSMTGLDHLLPTQRNRETREAIRYIDEVVADLVRRRIELGERKGDLLDVLIDHARDAGSTAGIVKALRDEAVGFLVAGHETTATSLAWAWFELARRPEIDERLWRESDRVLDERGPAFTDLRALDYSRMVFLETLRLYPPAWIMMREAAGPDVIGPLSIARGDVVMACPSSLHRDPRFWNRAEAFEPERFQDMRDPLHGKFSYIPFGIGPRTCIGNRFALMEGQIALAMTARLFRLELVPDQHIEPEPMITIRPSTPIGMRLRLRRMDGGADRESGPRGRAAPARATAGNGGQALEAGRSAS